MKYDDGMHILFDAVKKGVFAEFRGESHYLPGPFSNRSAAVAALEQRCPELGWSAPSF